MIDLNPEFQQAIKRIESGESNLFITGKAGTGKSTLLEYFRNNTDKKVAILAPTGVAALNVNGQTIHSFFHFTPYITPKDAKDQRVSTELKNIINSVDIIIIDEVSMVRADLMDCVDQALRNCVGDPYVPFGGIQMVFIGDIYQLPPVVSGDEEREMFKSVYPSPYFFDAHVFQDGTINHIELTTIYRQQDQDFINLLSSIRNNTVGHQHLQYLNQRHNPTYQTQESEITLTTTNAAAREINQEELQRLEGEMTVFEGKATGGFENKQLPTEEILKIKKKAQVMMLNNDPAGRWVNGSMGVVEAIGWDDEREQDVLKVRLSTGKIVDVLPHTWDLNRYLYDADSQSLDTEAIGSFTQYPLRLAWAVTIHKSQGKTFDRVVVDIGRGTFAHGQMYVALSRCTSMDGLILRKAIEKRHIKMDWRVSNFMKDQENMWQAGQGMMKNM
ncbi:MAG: DEAD/DEAH box helicase [Candidatus Gracilibacteria bacterium]|nr:DEAD/DEAH box helicase [Candidatus Gracilibacteria bacterium]